jgi:hypothetical protein
VNPTVPSVVVQFESSPDTAQILAQKLKGSGTLTLELQAKRFSQIQGKTRWRITGQMRLSQGESEGRLAIDFPVFLDHPHHGEDQAFLAAIPQLERKVEQLQATFSTPVK